MTVLYNDRTLTLSVDTSNIALAPERKFSVKKQNRIIGKK